MSSHEHIMQRALALAAQARGCTAPNPLVGAVIIKDGEVIGEGYHHQAGTPHAEIHALNQAGEQARSATLYVTLAPCCHHGRTPPCTDALITAGIETVYYACEDPNPLVANNSRRALEAAGISVNAGVCESEARHLNRAFFCRIEKKRPYVTAKFAMSLDGKIATRSGHSQWITHDTARQRAHALRAECDAIAVGRGTLEADNPRLTVRLGHDRLTQPVPYVLTARPDCKPDHMLFENPKATLVTTEAQGTHYTQAGWTALLTLPEHNGRCDITALLRALYDKGHSHLLVEGGAGLLGSFFDSGLVDEVAAFIAPIIIGGTAAPSVIGGTGIDTLSDALRLQNPRAEVLDGNYLIMGETTCSPAS